MVRAAGGRWASRFEVVQWCSDVLVGWVVVAGGSGVGASGCVVVAGGCVVVEGISGK